MKIDPNRPVYSLSVAEYIELNREILSENKLTSSAPTEEFPEIMNIDQASAFLKIAKQSIYMMTSKRDIPFIKRGKRVVFRKTDLLSWLDGGRRQTREEINNDGINLR